MNIDNYSLIYNFKCEQKKKGFTKDEVKQRLAEGEELGACDAFMFVSIIRNGLDPHKGSKSFNITSRDGFKQFRQRDHKIPDTEVFQVLTALAQYLIEAPHIPDWQRSVCQHLMKDVRIAMGIK